MSRNNWLSINLPDNARTALGGIAQHIEANAGAVFGDPTITFQPMALDDVHMTILFIGDGLHRLKYPQLQQFHTGATEAGNKACTLKFVGYSLFPPDKNNLVVARFEAEKPLHQFSTKLLEAGEKVGLNGLREKHNFEPHITLGKIGATRAQVQKLVKNGITVPPLAPATFSTNGVYLCGAIPPQGSFDWTISWA